MKWFVISIFLIWNLFVFWILSFVYLYIDTFKINKQVINLKARKRTFIIYIFQQPIPFKIPLIKNKQAIKIRK